LDEDARGTPVSPSAVPDHALRRASENLRRNRYQVADAEAQAALRDGADPARALLLIGQANLALHGWETALEAGRAAEESGASSEAAVLQSRALAGMGRREEAVGQAERATQLDPTRREAWVWRGLMAGESGDPRGALDAVGRAIRIAPWRPRQWNLYLGYWATAHLGATLATLAASGVAGFALARSGLYGIALIPMVPCVLLSSVLAYRALRRGGHALAAVLAAIGLVFAASYVDAVMPLLLSLLMRLPTR
jgi:tetratricopeptide (TPR) repeat protein